MLARLFSCALRNFSRSSATTAQLSPDEFVLRRHRLVDRIREHSPEHNARPLVIVVPSARVQFSAPDVPYPFSQCSYFRYLTGLLLPNAALVIIAEPRPVRRHPLTIVYIPSRSVQEELWEGPMMLAEEVITLSGVHEVKDYAQSVLDLNMLVSGAVTSFDIANVRHADDNLAKVLTGCKGMVPLREHVDALRWVKSPTEQNLMRQTCEIGAQSMNATIAKCRNVWTENEIVGRLELEARRRGAARLAYPPVVAAANRANTIHYLEANRLIGANDSVLVDAGCDLEGYASDVTRVFPVSGQFTVAQRALYDALYDVQTSLLRHVVEWTPNLSLAELYAKMIEHLAANLQELGLFVTSLSNHDLLRMTESVCPHHVSHYLGLDVHDTSSVARNIPMVPGVVFTIEPGVYLRSDNDAVKKDFRGLGMRIEDDILLVEEGKADVLTNSAVSDATHIELLMQRGHATSI